MSISTSKQLFLQGVVLCAASIDNDEKRNKFWEHVLDSTINKFRMIAFSNTLPKQYHEERVKQKVLFYIDNFVGKNLLQFIRHLIFLVTIIPDFVNNKSYYL